MIITGLTTRVAPFSNATWLDQQRVSTPLSGIAEYSERRSSWRGPGSDLVWVLLRTDDPDVFGVGQSRGGAVTAALIDEHLSRFVVGRDAAAIAQRTFEMRMAALPYADGGLSAMAVSAIELAMWDLQARAAGVPLSHLLGGSDGAEAPYYLTVPHLEILESLPAEVVAAAHTVKIPASHGPVDGARGRDAVLADVRAVRELVPDHVPISVDCFMSWDTAFVKDFARRADAYGLGWIEEPLLPRDFSGYAELARSLGPTSVAGGEHLFSLADGARFVEGRCAQVMQVDATWCGGLTTAATLGRLAVDAGMRFAPHAASLQPWSLHLVAAFGPGALLEILTGIEGWTGVPAPSTGPGVGIDPAAVGLA